MHFSKNYGLFGGLLGGLFGNTIAPITGTSTTHSKGLIVNDVEAPDSACTTHNNGLIGNVFALEIAVLLSIFNGVCCPRRGDTGSIKCLELRLCKPTAFVLRIKMIAKSEEAKKSIYKCLKLMEDYKLTLLFTDTIGHHCTSPNMVIHIVLTSNCFWLLW